MTGPASSRPSAQEALTARSTASPRKTWPASLQTERPAAARIVAGRVAFLSISSASGSRQAPVRRSAFQAALAGLVEGLDGLAAVAAASGGRKF